MFFLKKRNPLMRQSSKKLNTISTNDMISIINTFNQKLDEQTQIMSQIYNLLKNNNFTKTSNVDHQSVETELIFESKARDCYIPDPDISSITSSNKKRKIKTMDSKSISDALDSLNEFDQK